MSGSNSKVQPQSSQLAFSFSVSVSFIFTLKQLGQVRLANFSWILHYCFGDNFIVITPLRIILLVSHIRYWDFNIVLSGEFVNICSADIC